MRLTIELNRDDLANLPYAIIVEQWHNIAGREAGGAKRRKYHAAFTPAERKKIARYYTKYFYKWYLVTGLPKRHNFRKIETIELIKRAGNFFASV